MGCGRSVHAEQSVRLIFDMRTKYAAWLAEAWNVVSLPFHGFGLLFDVDLSSASLSLSAGRQVQSERVPSSSTADQCDALHSRIMRTNNSKGAAAGALALPQRG